MNHQIKEKGLRGMISLKNSINNIQSLIKNLWRKNSSTKFELSD